MVRVQSTSQTSKVTLLLIDYEVTEFVKSKRWIEGKAQT
jgi:hypothetical protein